MKPKILIPVDLSDPSATGFEYARELSKKGNFELNVLHVGKDIDSPGLHSIVGNLTYEDSIQYRIISRTGEVSEQIIKTVSDTEPELVIMSADVFDKGKKFYAESQTGTVLENLRIPLLIIPPNAEFTAISHIVIATNLGENIIEIVKHVLAIFRAFHPEIVILIFSEEKDAIAGDEIPDLISRLRNYSEYNDLSGHLSDQKDSGISLSLYAEETNVDLICIVKNSREFDNVFFKNSPAISHMSNKVYLILPKYW